MTCFIIKTETESPAQADFGSMFGIAGIAGIEDGYLIMFIYFPIN